MTAPNAATTDVISVILGLDESSRVAQLRNDRPQQVAELQAYYDAIFSPSPESAAALSLPERLAVAIRVASHAQSGAVVAWYRGLALANGVDGDTIARLEETDTPLTDDSRLAAAVRHADLLTTTPVAARPTDLQALKDAGFNPAGIVSLSQVIAFVSYQLRLIAGLRALEELA